MSQSARISYHRRVRSTKDPLHMNPLRLASGEEITFDVRIDASAQPYLETAMNVVRAKVRANEQRALRLSMLRAVVRETMYRTPPFRWGRQTHTERTRPVLTDLRRTFKATRHLSPVA
jgi:hypothetical protein